MANIFGIEVSGDTYDIEDSQARQDIQTAESDIDELESSIENKQNSIVESVVYGESRSATLQGGTVDWYSVVPPIIPAGKKVLRYFAECSEVNARAFIGYGKENPLHAPNALLICLSQTATVTFRLGAVVF